MIKKWSLLLVVVMALPLPAQQLVEGIMAVVGNEIILRSEVEQYAQQYIIQNRINVQQNPELVNRVKKQTLDFLIEQKLLLEKAEQDTITVEDQQLDQLVEQRIDAYVERLGSQDELEKMFGQSIKNIRKELRKMVREEEMVKQVRALKFADIKVSRREVEQFYKEYQDSLPTMEETVDISHIL
jgi:peptidyl-prolyl cis-trans isomerase SurA